MAILSTGTVIMVAEEETKGYAKAGLEDYTSDTASASLTAETDSVLGSIVKVVVGSEGTGGIVNDIYRFVAKADEPAVDLTAEDYTDNERWINTGVAWANTDAVLVQNTSGLNLSITSLERNNFNGSYVACKSLSGIESSSGNLDVELAVKNIGGTEAGNLKGHKIITAGFGKYVEKGANVVVGTSVAEVATGTGTHDLYRLAQVSENIPTLAVRQYEGGNVDAVMDFGGVVVESTTLNLSAGEVANITSTVGGTRTYVNTDTQPTPPALSCGLDPFVTKNIAFKVDGTTIDASDVTVTLTNTTSDRNFVTSSGIGDRVTTAKGITVSFTVDFKDLTEYTKYKANADATLYIRLVNSAGDDINVYFPKLSRTEVTRGDTEGVLTQAITLNAVNDSNGNAVYLASKKA